MNLSCSMLASNWLHPARTRPNTPGSLYWIAMNRREYRRSDSVLTHRMTKTCPRIRSSIVRSDQSNYSLHVGNLAITATRFIMNRSCDAARKKKKFWCACVFKYLKTSDAGPGSNSIVNAATKGAKGSQKCPKCDRMFRRLISIDAKRKRAAFDPFYFILPLFLNLITKASRNQVTCVERPRTLVVVVYW